MRLILYLNEVARTDIKSWKNHHHHHHQIKLISTMLGAPDMNYILSLEWIEVKPWICCTSSALFLELSFYAPLLLTLFLDKP